MTDDTRLILEQIGKLEQRMDKFGQRMDNTEAQINNVKTTLETQIESVEANLKEAILRFRMEFAAKLRENMALLPTKKDYKKLFEYIEFIDKEIAEHRTNTEAHLASQHAS